MVAIFQFEDELKLNWTTTKNSLQVVKGSFWKLRAHDMCSIKVSSYLTAIIETSLQTQLSLIAGWW